MIKKLEIYDRVLEETQFIIENKATIRQTANNFGLGKSTVHTHLRKVLPTMSYYLSDQVNDILMQNWDEKHLRGGIETKKRHSKK